MTFPPDDVFHNFSANAIERITTTPASHAKNINATTAAIFIEQLAIALNVYYTPVLIVLGCIGNLISIIVFYKSKLSLQSTSQYLSALACSDTLFLCQLVPPWLKAVGASTLFSRKGYCQLFVYLSYVTCNHSSWLVVAFTVERFVAVVYPLQRNVMCTVKRARYFIVSLAIAALVVNLPVLRFAVPNANDCNIDELLMSHAERFNLVDTAVSFTLPLAIIMVLNTWMYGVIRLGRTHNNLMRQQPDITQTPQTARAIAAQRSQQRTTRMLLIVSSVFVLLNLPAYTMRIVAYANNMSEKEYSGTCAALQQVCLSFFNTNFGINFVLYCLTGQNFRRALLEIFPWLRRRNVPRITINNSDQHAPPASSVTTSFVHSFSNNYSEATTSCAANSGMHMAGGRCVFGHSDGRNYRRHEPVHIENPMSRRQRTHEQKVIQRWKFDNSRQQQRRESIEMQELPVSYI